MPVQIDQPTELGDVPRLLDEKTARTKLMCGVNKWMLERQKIEHIQIGHRRFYTDDALNRYLRQQKVKPRRDADERRAAP